MYNSEHIKDINVPKNGLQEIQNELVFGGSPKMFAAFKKTEKLSSALFLVTQFIPPEEELRGVLRNRSIALLSTLVSLRTSTYTKRHPEQYARGLILEIISLLSVAHTADYISSMNVEILRKEYYTLLPLLAEEHRAESSERSSDEPRFAHGFFDVSDIEEEYRKGHSEKMSFTDDDSSRHLEVQRKMEKETSRAVEEIEHAAEVSGPPTRRHRSAGSLVRYSKRRESILLLLKEKPCLSVKDVSKSVPHVSEKTLQRELIRMVSEGILKKQGERRWSTYSLA